MCQYYIEKLPNPSNNRIWKSSLLAAFHCLLICIRHIDVPPKILPSKLAYINVCQVWAATQQSFSLSIPTTFSNRINTAARSTQFSLIRIPPRAKKIPIWKFYSNDYYVFFFLHKTYRNVCVRPHFWSYWTGKTENQYCLCDVNQKRHTQKKVSLILTLGKTKKKRCYIYVCVRMDNLICLHIYTE